MSVRHSSELIDRMLAPATRLMSRLRFGHKAMVIGASFILTCGALAGILMIRAQQESRAAHMQLAVTEGIGHLHAAMLAMQSHGQLVVRQAAKDVVSQGAIDATARQVEQELAAFDKWQQQALEGQSMHAPLAAVQAASRKALARHADNGKLVDDHDIAIRAMGELLGNLAQSSGLALATDKSVFYLGRAATDWLPLLNEYTGRQGLTGVRVLGEGAIWVDDRTDLAVSHNMQAFASNQITLELKKIQAVNPKLATDIGASLHRALAAMDKQTASIQKNVLDADTPSLPVKVMAARTNATRAAMAAAMKAANQALAGAANEQIASLQRRTALTAAWVLLVLLLSGYLFLGFSRSTRSALHEIEQAAEQLSLGQFPDAVRVDTRDEIKVIATALERAVATLRAFEQAQQTLYKAHQAGDIDQRLDTEAFPGSFGVMADEINALVDSHLQVNARVIEVVSAYAKGDLSSDIERYPGQKAQITAAVDAVKAGTQAVNAQISALVEAAVAGDFSHRGDAGQFDFVYRDLIVGLNTLMATADDGLNELGALLSAVADGDLNRRILVTLPGRFGHVADDANRTVETLTSIVARIRQGSDAINAAAGEIAAGNNDLSQRTEQQAASLEETASSMEELTSTVRQNADNANQANRLAMGAKDVAEKGGNVVDQVVRTMSAINDSSKKIADIIGVIDGIAFQTNILALNAAVEAARAGEQGRGFAVVAAEVRSLAQRSAGAAKEIKQLITDSVVRVDEGSKLVDRAGQTMGEIVDSVKQVTEIIADIAAASAEQTSGIEQVNQAVVQMDEGTQQNAALVEEAAASAHSLEQQAEALVRAVSVFSFDDDRALLESPGAGVIDLPTMQRARKAAAAAPAAAPSKPRPARKSRGNGVSPSGDAHWQEF